MRADRNRAAERGSALLLVPAAFVALLVLAAIAVDQSLLFAARRQLIDVAASAANDAAAAVDEAAYRRSGNADLTVPQAEASVAEALAARGLDDEVSATVTVSDGPDGPNVVVQLTTDVRSVFARMAPGGYDQTTVRVAASSTLSAF